MIQLSKGFAKVQETPYLFWSSQVEKIALYNIIVPQISLRSKDTWPFNVVVYKCYLDQ